MCIGSSSVWGRECCPTPAGGCRYGPNIDAAFSVQKAAKVDKYSFIVFFCKNAGLVMGDWDWKQIHNKQVYSCLYVDQV